MTSHRSCIHVSCTRTLPFAETYRQVTCSGYNTRYDRWYVLFGKNCIQPFFRLSEGVVIFMLLLVFECIFLRRIFVAMMRPVSLPAFPFTGDH